MAGGGGYALDAVLFHSRRKEGKVEQVFIKHLGTLREGCMSSTTARCRFWEEADRRLASLNLENDTQKSIEEQLIRRVRRPD